jgi:hypothetical protein
MATKYPFRMAECNEDHATLVAIVLSSLSNDVSDVWRNWIIE